MRKPRCSDISHEFRRHAVAGLNKKSVPILWARNVAEIGLTYARRGFNERIENDFEIEGRAADNLEHVGGGSLLI